MATWRWLFALATAMNLAGVASASSADIWAVGSTADKQTYIFVDAATLTPQGAGVQSLSLYEVFVGTALQQENGAKYFLMTVFFNCASRQYSNRTLTVYDPNGKILANTPMSNTQYQDAAAGSPGGMALGFACTPASSWAPTYFHVGSRVTAVEAADALYKANTPGG